MSKQSFISPRFVGARFEQVTLPLVVARDLAAYEELVVELAKHLYRRKHPDRIKVPRGFAREFSLHLDTTIQSGSAIPSLVAVFATSMLISPLPAEFLEAKDLINQVIATPQGEALPDNFPSSFYSYFNRIGRSLGEGEFIEWQPESSQNKAILDQAKRIQLVRSHRNTYEATIDEIGHVVTLDTVKPAGFFRRLTGDVVPFIYSDPFFSDLKKAFGVERMFVRLRGIGSFDGNDSLNGIPEIEEVDLLPHWTLVSAVEKLALLKAGWLDGHGALFSSETIAQISQDLSQAFPMDLEYPIVVPTGDGHVCLEWIRPQSRIELEANTTDQQLELYATNVGGSDFLDDTFPLYAWDMALARVAQLLPA